LAQKDYNFGSDRWIALKILQGFSEAVFLGVAIESLLRDVEVWLAILEYRLKWSITFDSTVGSRLKFYKGSQRLFSLG
jgi:hypothetical protein